MFNIRSLAASSAYFFQSGRAVWTDWSINKAVKDGYKASGWVYRAVSLVARSGASVPWVVFNEEGEAVPEHPVSMMFQNPHPHFSRQKLIELLLSWMELSGNAYVKVVRDSTAIQELWPISPDRIAPIPSSDLGKMLDGYKIINEKGIAVTSPDFTADNVLHFMLTDPSNPLGGIGPLQAAARDVDLDNDQQDWNMSTMQNRGVIDGVFTFKKDLTAEQGKSITKKIEEKFLGILNARKPLVLGSEAQYTRLALGPVELDFLDSRKFNREAIFIIFGVPPQLAGVMDVSTYNNFSTSLRILWEATVIPLLDNLADSFNNAFKDDLEKGLRIGYDLSNIAALRKSEEDKSKTAKNYFEMGVPVENINEKLELGLTEYGGWDLPWGGKALTTDKKEKTEEEERGWSLIPLENRSAKEEQEKRDVLAETVVVKEINLLLEQQKAKVFSAIEKGEDPVSVIKEDRKSWIKSLSDIYLLVAVDMAETVVLDHRELESNLERRAILDQVLLDKIEEMLLAEAVILNEYSHIEDATVSKILDQVRSAATNGLTIAELTRAIEDAGIFEPERALRIARTVAGTSSSIGQLSAGEVAGATHKTWVTSGFEVRDAHVNREGETVKIGEKFSAQVSSVGPRYPLDQDLNAEDRINCRCSMTFSIENTPEK